MILYYPKIILTQNVKLVKELNEYIYCHYNKYQLRYITFWIYVIEILFLVGIKKYMDMNLSRFFFVICENEKTWITEELYSDNALQFCNLYLIHVRPPAHQQEGMILDGLLINFWVIWWATLSMCNEFGLNPVCLQEHFLLLGKWEIYI